MLRWLLASLLIIVVAGCSAQEGGDKVVYMQLADVPQEKLVALSQKSYFFGHQSVGRNILEGLQLLMAEYPALQLKIVEGVDPALAGPGVLLNANLGLNREPATKLAAFEQAMNGGLGGKVDTAFLKFCYVDMNREGNPAQLFADYKKEVDELKGRYPDTALVHFTLPIKSVPAGIKITIKNLIGREVPEQLDDASRAEYNDLMRKEYQGKEPLFDIAYFESIAAGTGRRTTFKLDGQVVEAMAPENTDDGGHLTDAGKRWIAEQLVVFLANM